MNLATASRFATAVLVVAIVTLLFRHELFADTPLGLALQGLALLLMLWARLTFGRRSFHASASPTEGGLVTTGPYRYWRHPIYAAVLLFMWTGVICHFSPAAALLGLLATVATAVRIGAEETLVRQRYPEYAEYAARTKRLVPFVFCWLPIALALFLNGCSNSDSDSPTSFMPLAAGNEWTYLMFDAFDSTTAPIVMTGEANIEGYNYFVLLAFDWTPEGLSLAIVDRYEQTFMGIEALLKFPPPAEPYEYTSTREHSFWYIVPGEDEIDTPAGHFHAITYRVLFGDDHRFLLSISFADGVGFVRLVTAQGNTWLLKSYELRSGGRIPFNGA